MSDIKFVIIDKEDVPLDQLSTSELADRADARNPGAYAAASEQDLPEDQFRAALLEILGGVEDHSAADKDALTCAVRTAQWPPWLSTVAATCGASTRGSPGRTGGTGGVH